MYKTSIQITRYVIIIVASISLMFTVILKSHAKTLTTEDIVIEFRLPSAKISLNEPVLIELTIKNQSDEKIRFNLGPDAGRLIDFNIRSPASETFSTFHYQSKEGIQRSGRKQLLPGETYRDTLILNKWYSFNAVGLYEIKPHILAAIISDSGKVEPAINQIIRLTQTPRDETRLKFRANELLLAASTGHSNERNLSAEILSYHQDSVAVPALAELLSGDNISQQFAIEGLMRIANLQAVKVLSKYLGELDKNKLSYVIFALASITRQASDPAIVNMAQSALKKHADK